MPNSFLEVAIDTAREAGKVLREEYARPPEIKYKGDVDLVTQADKRSEQAIVDRLSKYFPTHAIAAEEGLGKDHDADFRWHVVLLDGKTNVAHGFPGLCVSIAL